MPIDSAEKSRRGRPPVRSEAINVRMLAEYIAGLDRHIAEQPDSKLTRPEAIRRIVVEWLRAREYLPGSDERVSVEASQNARREIARGLAEKKLDKHLVHVDATPHEKEQRKAALTKPPRRGLR